MPSEVSIAKQLSGSECREALLDSIRNMLVHDDRFANHVAYSGFTATIDLKFCAYQSFVPPVDRTFEVSKGDVSGTVEDDVSLKVEIPLRPPNQVREEADLPLPVLVIDEKGQSHEKWKRVGKNPPKEHVPHNKVKGA